MNKDQKLVDNRRSLEMRNLPVESSMGSQNSVLEIPYEDLFRSFIPVKGLSTWFQDGLLSEAGLIDLQSGESLAHQGEEDADVLYLLSGSIELISEHSNLKDMNAGTEPARHALDQFTHEPFVVKAVSASILLRVKRDLLERLLVIDPEDDALGLIDPAVDLDDHWLAQFLQTELMMRLPAASMRKVIGQLETLLVRTGDQVFAQGMSSDYYYIVREGRCSVYYFNHGSGKKIELAELTNGDYFGDETEHNGERYCNQVKMLSNGLLLRLAKVDYSDLQNSKGYPSLSFSEASSRVSEGLNWLDVRFNYEYARNGKHDSFNISLNQLKGKLDNLAKDQQYIVYCDTGVRSSAATMLLLEEGFDAVHLEGGMRKVFRDKEMSDEWIDGLSDRLRGKQVATGNMFRPSPVEKETFAIGEQMTEIDQRIRGLKQLFTIPQEQQDQAEFSTRANCYSAEDVEDLSVLIEARKQIDQMDGQQDLSQPLGVEANESALGSLHKQLENAQHQLNIECTKGNISAEKDGKGDRLKQVTNELEIIKNKLKEQESVELKRREGFEQQLVIERKKMSEQLARFASGIEQQQSRSLEIERVKQLAVQESQMLIVKFKSAHEEYRQRHTMTIQKVRKQLQQQASHVLEKARKAQMEKAQALQALHEVQKQLDDLREARGLTRDHEQRIEGQMLDVPLLLDIESMSTQIDETKQTLNVDIDIPTISSANASTLQKKAMLIEQDEKVVRNKFVDLFESDAQLSLEQENLTKDQKQRLKRVKKIAHEALEQAFKGKQPLKN